MYKLMRKLAVNFIQFVKWVVVSGVIGIVVGLVGTAFFYGMKAATNLRQANPYIIWGLPVAGLFIVGLYQLAHKENDRGTNTVLAAVRSEGQLTFSVAPLIFVSTLLTHLFGGSAGREGAALQMGGSIGNWFGKLLHMNKTDVHVMVMCGMSACFSALFGTPMAAAIFSMEVVSVGVMYYAALVPCAFASLVALGVAQYFGVPSEAMVIEQIPEFNVLSGGKVVVVAALLAGVSMLFCVVLHGVSTCGKKWLPNPYLRIVVMGLLVVVLHMATGTEDYMGAGMEVIERCMHGEVNAEAFLLKMLLT
ncbi:MAG: chloride channel protein, partial [Lachnospiraceae bacterium]|nr:chloride channel protein [Lachnospiraceae bacterium]